MTRGELGQLACALCLALLLGVAPALAQESAALLSQARKGRLYLPPTRAELAQAEELFTRTLAGEESASLSAAWQTLGFELLALRERDEDFLVVRERLEEQRGRGFYLLRRGASQGICWQAPHSFRDEETGVLALQLMQEGKAAAASWNTAPRDTLEQSQSDLAHAEESYLTAFTRALLKVRPQLQVAQLHGFAKSNRTSSDGASADLILSRGENQPDASLTALGACLQQALPLPVRLYPSQVKELGGTTNRIGALLRAGGSEGFLHLELSRAMRTLLKTDSAARRALAACLGDRS